MPDVSFLCCKSMIKNMSAVYEHPYPTLTMLGRESQAPYDGMNVKGYQVLNLRIRLLCLVICYSVC